MIVALLALALLIASAAYQTGVRGRIAVGGPLSRAVLGGSEAQGAEATERGLFYTDELDADGGRSRLTRQRATIRVPGLGETGPLALGIEAQGWPADVLGTSAPQPTVEVFVDGAPVGEFVPEGRWEMQRLDVPERSGDTLTIELVLSEVFTSTASHPEDVRPHGIRLRSVEIAATDAPLPATPSRSIAMTLMLAAVLGYLGLRRWLGWRWAAALALGWMLVLALAVALLRIWAAPIAAAGLAVAALLALIGALPMLSGLARGLLARLEAGQALEGGALLAALLIGAVLLVQVGRALGTFAFQHLREREVDGIALSLLMLAGLVLVVLRAQEAGDLARRIKGRLSGRWGMAALLALLALWLGYEWSLARALPYAGHADYSDNAVVARNLLRGRGWTVDYVTQFYELNPGGSVVRPQETWPLLQPVWILPFFALFGPHAWAAKIPNLIFYALLALGMYGLSARIWGRVAGAVAVALTLTNLYMVRLALYVTNDLGFTLFAFGALALLLLAHLNEDEQRRRRLLLYSGLLVGLMCLQKPSGAVLAAGMGLWWLSHQLRGRARWGWRQMIVLWGVPALLVLSPYLVRNIVTFGAPVYSTESRDAWILGFRGDGGWEDIYKLYTTEGGLQGEGVPDKSWVLRWGFERTFQKIEHQFEAVRNYLLPPLPGPLSGKASLLGLVTTWLALAGVAGARDRSGQLLGLLAAAYAPYILFLCLYWHADEERYFVPLIPWLALYAGAGLRGLAGAIGRGWGGRGAALALPLGALLLLLAIYQPAADRRVDSGWEKIGTELTYQPQLWATDIAAFDWLRENTPEDSVVMTRVPWQLSFHADRQALMTPNTADLTTLLRIARYYGADYVLVNAIQNEKAGARATLAPLLAGDAAYGFTLEQSLTGPDGRTIYIYRFPADYGGAPEITLP